MNHSVAWSSRPRTLSTCVAYRRHAHRRLSMGTLNFSAASNLGTQGKVQPEELAKADTQQDA